MTCATTPPRRHHPRSRPRPRARAVADVTLPALRALLALLLATSWVLAAAVGADAAVVRSGFESPSDGSRITQSTKVSAYVDHGPPGEVDRVEVRFLRNGAVASNAHALSRTEDSDTGGGRRSRYAATFDPMSSAWHGGGVVANGRYVLEMRVRERYGDSQERWTPWTAGPQVTVDAPPPATQVTARLADPETRAIEVGWSTVGTKLPDFTRYVVQRNGPDGDWQEAYVSLDASEGSFTDVVADEGTYRYRVTVHRVGGDSVERSSAPADSGAVETRPSGQASPEPGDDAGSGDDEAREDDGLRERSSGAIRPSSGPRGNVPSSIRPRSSNVPRTGRPDVNPSSIFEETIDYGEVPEGEQTITERRVVATGDGGATGGGMLNVLERELAPEQILVPIAAGLVFTMSGLHIRRFLKP